MKNLNKNEFIRSACAVCLFSFSLLILLSCEEQELNVKPDAANNADNPRQLQQDPAVVGSFYVAELSPLNNSGVSGTAVFQYAGRKKLNAYVEATGLAPKIRHAQHIHLLNDCPPSEIAGVDGLITIGEGIPYYGGVYIPLDNNLASLSSELYPLTNVAQRMVYHAVTDLEALLSALNESTPEDLNLNNRTVVLHGAFIKDGRVVPAETAGATYIGSLPVACGTIIPFFL